MSDAGSVIGAYPATGVALVLLVAAVTWSQLRETRAIRALTLVLPTYVAAFEACEHFTWMARCHGLGSAPTLADLHHQFLVAGATSVAAVAGTAVIAVLLAVWCRAGVAADSRSRWWLLAAIPPLASVATIWLAAERLFFHPLIKP